MSGRSRKLGKCFGLSLGCYTFPPHSIRKVLLEGWKDRMSFSPSRLTRVLYSTQDFKKQFDTNFFGAMNVTRSILPHFRQQHSGTLVFIGSFVGFCSVGRISPYASSKFALEGR